MGARSLDVFGRCMLRVAIQVQLSSSCRAFRCSRSALLAPFVHPVTFRNHKGPNPAVNADAHRRAFARLSRAGYLSR